MLFPEGPAELRRAWRAIAAATAAGGLGCSAKAATVYELMGAVEDVNVLSSEGDSALVACAAVGRLDVLSKLLTAGANPDATSNSGMSALAASSMSGCT